MVLNVATTAKWVTQEEWTAYETAISAAIGVLENVEATQTEVVEAVISPRKCNNSI